MMRSRFSHLLDAARQQQAARTSQPHNICCEAEGGTYALEMALMMPLYLMLIFGFTSVALLLFVYCEASYASRAAVRFASVRSATNGVYTPCSAADISNLVTALMPGLSGGTLSFPSYGCTGSNAAGSLITVTVQVRYPVGLPYIAASGITLSSTARGYIVR